MHDDHAHEIIGLLERLCCVTERIHVQLQNLLTREDLEMAALDDLQTQVTANTTVIGSALTLIQGFAAQLAAAGTDPAKLADLQSQLKSSDDALAAAVAANTPAAPPATTGPAPTV